VPEAIGPVVSPREVTYRVTFQQWLTDGVETRRIFPTICSQRCSVA